jgi:hypothetical protein
MAYTAIILLVAVALNYADKRNLLITLLVGFSMLLPMQLLEDSYYIWYGVCIGSELVKIVTARLFKSTISYPVMFLSSLMILCHCISFYFDGFTNPYHTIMPTLEYMELLVCILFSIPILKILIKRFKCLLKL